MFGKIGCQGCLVCMCVVFLFIKLFIFGLWDYLKIYLEVLTKSLLAIILPKKNHQFELLIMNTEGIDILKQQRNQRPMTCHQTVVVLSNYFVNMSIC